MRPPSRTSASARSRPAPWTSTSAASSPPGAKRRTASATSSRFPSTAASAPSFRTSATPSGPDPAARAEHHQRMPGCEAQLIIEADQRGDAVGAERSRLLGAQALRNRRDLVLGDGDVLGVEPAPEAVRVHAIAQAKALRPIAERDDLARPVIADDLRERALPELDLARADVRVPDADPRAVEPDEYLVPPRPGHREHLGVENLGPSEPVDRRRLHLSRNRCLHGRPHRA